MPKSNPVQADDGDRLYSDQDFDEPERPYRPLPAPKQSSFDRPVAVVSDTGMSFVITRRSALVALVLIIFTLGSYGYALIDIVKSRDNSRTFYNNVLRNYVCNVEVLNPNDPGVIKARQMLECTGYGTRENPRVPSTKPSSQASSFRPRPSAPRTSTVGANPAPSVRRTPTTPQRPAQTPRAEGSQRQPSPSTSTTTVLVTPRPVSSAPQSKAILNFPGCNLTLLGIAICRPPASSR